MKKIYLMLSFLAIAVLLNGCETVKGVGQDIQNTGDNIWEAVTKDKSS